jgi:serine acetyltransferase
MHGASVRNGPILFNFVRIDRPWDAVVQALGTLWAGMGIRRGTRVGAGMALRHGLGAFLTDFVHLGSLTAFVVEVPPFCYGGVDTQGGNPDTGDIRELVLSSAVAGLLA